MELRFITPLRLKKDGRPNLSPTFVDVTHGLLRRLHFLSVLYGGAEPAGKWRQPYMAAADEVRVERQEFRPLRMTHYSGRQLRQVPTPCVTGGLCVSGDLAALRPVFEFGQWLNIGSNTSMGLGCYILKEAAQ